MSRALHLGAALVAALGSWSCKTEPPDQQRTTLRDEGLVCFIGAGVSDAGAAAVELRAERALGVVVKSKMCLSTSCSTKRVGTCGIKRVGDRITLTSELAWTSPSDFGQRCSHDCSPVEARCTTDVLPAGHYTIAHGTALIDLELPSTIRGACDVAPRPPPNAGSPPDASVSAATTPTMTAVASAAPPATAAPSAPAPPRLETFCYGPPDVPKSGAALKSGRPIAVAITRRNACEGNACLVTAPTCTAKRKGREITLTTSLPKNAKTVPCTADCPALVAQCKTDALLAGSYTIGLGTLSATFQVPSPSVPPCVR